MAGNSIKVKISELPAGFYITPSEYAVLNGVSRQSVSYWIKQGKLTIYQLGWQKLIYLGKSIPKK